MTRQPFSVLLPVYRGDSPQFLERAFDSATREQVRVPDEVVIVRDGPVGPEISEALERFERSEFNVKVIRLEVNGGLADALQVGLAECTHEIVARADADDVSMPDRFSIQVPRVEAGLDMVGSALLEFSDDENVTGELRRQPLTGPDIAKYARFHDPFNHPSVVYRKSAVEAAGGYQHLHLMEDYLLFARMIANGARVANVSQALVKYRVGAGAYARRGGRELLRSEIALQRTLRAEGFTTRWQFVRNIVLRGGYRLVPQALRRNAYRKLILGRRTLRSQGDV